MPFSSLENGANDLGFGLRPQENAPSDRKPAARRVEKSRRGARMQNDTRFRIISRAMGMTAFAAVLAFGLSGCHHNSANSGQDPADANMAAANGQQPTQVMGESASYSPQQQGESYPEGQQAPAPIVQGNPNAEQTYPGGYGPDDSAEAAGEEAIEQTAEAPPPLPEYDQPPCPGPDYIWTPGYWAWGPDGYYWVPGAWVEAPYYGALWTPPYWGWYNGYYRFHRGYWGPHVGYYGGIDYGFGYIGIGFFGGYWSGHNFYYNRDVTRIGGGIHNYYSRPVVYNNVRYSGRPSNRTSYNGGRGGINARPNASEMAAARERHDSAMPVQREARTTASRNRGQFFSQNHGRPASVAETRGFANGRGIAAPPRGVEPGRAPNAAPNPAARGGAEHGYNGARPREAPNAAPRVNPGVNPDMNPGERNRNNALPPRNMQPNRTEPAPRVENRPQPQQRMENRPAPQPQQRMQAPRMENRPAPQQQQRMENRPAPQQRMQAPRMENRPAPQQHMQAPRPAPQQHMQAPRPAPQQHAAPAPRPAPQQHGGGGGGNDHDHH
jgi:hypothetical protein